MRSSFVPRPARLTLVLQGARLIDVRMTNDQARALVRAWRAFRDGESPPMHDRDVVELLISELMHARKLAVEALTREAMYARGDPIVLPAGSSSRITLEKADNYEPDGLGLRLVTETPCDDGGP